MCNRWHLLSPDAFRTEAGKCAVPPHHGAVYDLCPCDPMGKYQLDLQGHIAACWAPAHHAPSAVHCATYPFIPRIPCHHIIASSHFGGFKGKWSKSSPVSRKNWHRPFRAGSRCRMRKLHEGVRSGPDGQLTVNNDAMWKFGDTRKVTLGVKTAKFYCWDMV